MSRDLGPSSGRGPETDNEPLASTASNEVDSTTEAGEPRMVDPFGSTESSAEPEPEFSLVDPLFYAPLLLVGAALVVFPEPTTTFIGLLCVVTGVFLAVVDLLSPSETMR